MRKEMIDQIKAILKDGEIYIVGSSVRLEGSNIVNTLKEDSLKKEASFNIIQSIIKDLDAANKVEDVSELKNTIKVDKHYTVELDFSIRRVYISSDIITKGGRIYVQLMVYAEMIDAEEYIIFCNIMSDKETELQDKVPLTLKPTEINIISNLIDRAELTAAYDYPRLKRILDTLPKSEVTPSISALIEKFKKYYK